MWRLKSKSIWLAEGDNNTNFFHNYANHRRNVNTIIDIQDETGTMEKQFQEKTTVAVKHFSTLFTKPTRCPVIEILEVLRHFPKLINEDMNKDFKP